MKKNSLPKRKNPRLKGFDYSLPYVYFITISTFEKRDIFVDDKLNREVIKCLLEERDRLGLIIFVYCLMLNHIHFLIQPQQAGANISLFIRSFKSKSYKIFKDLCFNGRIWQARFHDHIVRGKESLSEIMKYILNNPVRKNMVEKWDDYPYSGHADELV